jgi:hypothetical protein
VSKNDPAREFEDDHAGASSARGRCSASTLAADEVEGGPGRAEDQGVGRFWRTPAGERKRRSSTLPSASG